MSRALRNLLAAIVALGTLLGAAPVAAQDPLDIPPIDGTATDEQKAAVVAAVPCPATTSTGATRDNSDFSVNNGIFLDGDRVLIECDYVTSDQERVLTLKVEWFKPGATTTGSCGSESRTNDFDDESPAFGDVIRFVGKVDTTHSIQASYSEQLGFRDSGNGLEASLDAMLDFGRPFAAPCPAEITCPALLGSAAVDGGTFTSERGFSAFRCSYEEELEDGGLIRIGSMTKVFALIGTPPEDRTFVCSEPSAFSMGWGTEASDGRFAALVYYELFSPDPVDLGPVREAARALRDSGSESVATCEGVTIVPIDDWYTPLPPEFEAAFAPELIAGDPPPIRNPQSVASPTGASPTGQPGSIVGVSGETIGTLVRVAGFIAIVISVLMLFVTFLTVKRPTRLRPRMDVARIVISISVGLAMLFVFSRETPVWAMALAVVGGGGLGWWQGSNLQVFLKEKGLYAQRNQIAIAAFAGGIVLAQLAGILNRTGMASIGVAGTFLSAAMTAGLFVGRTPQVKKTRLAGAATVLFLIAAPAVLAFNTGESDAQDDPAATLVRGAILPENRTDATNSLIGGIDWTEVEFNGGIFADKGKPTALLEIPQALDSPPEPLVRDVSWTEEAQGTTYDLSETFTFKPRSDGFCCSIDYLADATITPLDGEVSVLTSAGSLTDITSVAIEGAGGGGAFGGPSLGAPFGPANLIDHEDPGSCGRPVGSVRSQDLLEASNGLGAIAVTMVSGPDVRINEFNATRPTITIDCDLGGLTIQGVLDSLPPPPAADDSAVRHGCPVFQEVVQVLANGVPGIAGVDTGTVGQLVTDPNSTACSRGALIEPITVGMDGRGNTRHEFGFDIAQPRLGEWDRGYNRWGNEDNWRSALRPYEIPEERRCGADANGTPLPPASREEGCLHRGFHMMGDAQPVATQEKPFTAPADGQVWIWTDWNYNDGPNVEVNGQFPWGSYFYRCHHCEPGDVSIANVIASWNAFGSGATSSIQVIDSSAPAPTTTEAAAEDVDDSDSTLDPETEALVDLIADDDASDAERAAIAAAIVGILGSAGMAGVGLIEAGMSISDVRDAVSARDRPERTGRGDLQPGAVVHDQWGDPLTVGPEGNIEFYDEDEATWRVLPADRAQQIITEQIGELSIYDPNLERRVYFTDPREMDVYADRVRRGISGDFWTTTEQDWRARQGEWAAQQAADAAAMAADRALIEEWERQQEQFRDRAVAGAIRATAGDPTMDGVIEAALERGDYGELAGIYSDWMFDQMDASQAEAEWQNTVANAARAGELTARAVEAAARTGMVVVTGPAGVAYTAAGLSTINAVSEGALSWQRGESAAQIAARSGLGVLAGVRDAAVGRMGSMPGVPSPLTAYASGTGDAMEAYARARLDGASHEQALAAAEVSFGAGFGSGMLGAGLDQLPPGMLQGMARQGLGGVTAGWATWMQGGSFGDGVMDGMAGGAGGWAGGRAGGRLSGMAEPGLLRPDLAGDDTLPVIRDAPTRAAQRAEDAMLSQLARDGKPRGTIPLEQQSQLVQDAFGQRTYEPAGPTSRVVVGDDGVARRVRVDPDPTDLRPVTDERLVLEGLSDTAGSRTGKNAPGEVQATINNTRDRIYGRSNDRTVERVSRVPAVEAMLRPGDEIAIDNFSTPGRAPSLGADRDARMVIRRPTANGGVELIEIPRQHWEQGAYADMAGEIRTIYDNSGGMPTHLVEQVQHRAAELSHLQHGKPPWTPQQIQARAVAETHNQLFTDRAHVEASSANSDQATRWVSVVDRDTVAAVTPALRESGTMQAGDQAFMRNNSQGEPEMVVRRAGDPDNELVVDPGEWRASHQEQSDALQARQAAWEADPANNPRPALQVAEQGQTTAEAARTKDGLGTISDPRGAQLMWEEKARFYAELNPPEAVEQARKGVVELLDQREGLRRQGLEVPPLNADQVNAMASVLRAGHGLDLPTEIPDLTRSLGAAYGNPDMSLAQSLSRMSDPHAELAFARPATPLDSTSATTTPGTSTRPMDSAALIRAVLAAAEQEEGLP